MALQAAVRPAVLLADGKGDILQENKDFNASHEAPFLLREKLYDVYRNYQGCRQGHGSYKEK